MRKLLLIFICFMISSPLFAGQAEEDFYIREGTGFLTMGNFARAAKAFEKAVNLNPDRADGYAGLGTSYLKLGASEAMTIPDMLEKAVTALQKSLEINPDNTEARYNLGLSHLALGQKDAALRQHVKLDLLDKQKAGSLLAKIEAYAIPQSYTFKPAATEPGSGISDSTKVYIRSNQVRVPVQLSYRSSTVDALLVLDTGANITMITTALANRLGIKPENTVRVQPRLADGSIVQAYSTHIDSITVGPKQRRNHQICILPVKDNSFGFGDGLLGMDFLSNYKYHLDVKRQTLEWQ